MPPAISNVSFPGLHGIKSASITITDGVQPSVALVTCASDNQLPEDVGTLQLDYDGTGTSLILPNSAVNQAMENSGSAGNTVTFQILDRRWRWKFAPPASGRFNRREPDGKVVPSSETTPQELVIGLFNLLGEVDYQVGDLPNDTRPEIDWIDADTSGALSQVVGDLGCTIVPLFDGTFAVRKRNVGEDPPINELTSSIGMSYQSPVRPGRILISGALIKYQAKWKLQAVGLDTDDEIKPLADLSYRPADGFGDPLAMEVAIRRKLSDLSEEEINEAIKRALLSVYRCYQVVDLAEGGFNMGNEGHGLDKLEQVLPLLDDLVETETNPVTGEKQPKAAYVIGTYYTGSMDDAVTEEGSPLPVSFSILHDKGIIIFHEPVTTFYFAPTGDRDADLRLIAAVNVQNNLGERLVTRRFGEQFERENEGVATIRKPELQAARIHVYADPPASDERVDVINNDQMIDDEAQLYIDEAELQYQGELGGAISYAGLFPVELDGRIRQVTYSIGPAGTQTTASANGQHDFSVPTDSQKREVSRREQHRRDTERDQILGSFYGRNNRPPAFIMQ